MHGQTLLPLVCAETFELLSTSRKPYSSWSIVLRLSFGKILVFTAKRSESNQKKASNWYCITQNFRCESDEENIVTFNV